MTPACAKTTTRAKTALIRKLDTPLVLPNVRAIQVPALRDSLRMHAEGSLPSHSRS